MEGENPTRRYKWFRPRQAARGHIVFNTAINMNRVALLNNSTGAFYLVVRDWAFGTLNSGAAGFGYVRDNNGTPGGIIAPLVPGDAAPPGLLTFFDDPGANFPIDYTGALSAQLPWFHDFPFAVLAPGWSLALWANAGADVSFIWEAILADELDFAYDL